MNTKSNAQQLKAAFPLWNFHENPPFAYDATGWYLTDLRAELQPPHLYIGGELYNKKSYASVCVAYDLDNTNRSLVYCFRLAVIKYARLKAEDKVTKRKVLRSIICTAADT